MLSQVRWFSVAIFVLLLFRLLAGHARAQVDNGSIVASAARVAAAKVTVTNLETNQAVELRRDDQGNYSAKLLHIGCAVKVEKRRFQSGSNCGQNSSAFSTIRILACQEPASRQAAQRRIRTFPAAQPLQFERFERNSGERR